MSGETDLTALLKNMTPRLNEGEYVFCTVNSLEGIDMAKVIGSFTEEEGVTIILKKEIADELQLTYSYVAAWITLNVHSSLEAVGLTAAVSNALAQKTISCNVIAAYYHDHIFVAQKDAQKAMLVLNEFAGKS